MTTAARTSMSFLLSILCLASCKVPTSAVKPVNNVPNSYYASAISDTLNIGTKPWEEFYQDSLLSILIDQGIAGSFDRTIAGNQIELSRTLVSMAQAGFLPVINGGVHATVEKFGDYTMNGIGNDDTNRSESLPPDQRLPNPYPELFAGVTFGWEANLWGKLSARKQAAILRMQASRELLHGITSIIVYTIADNYYELLGLDQRKEVLKENIELQELALELVHIQKDGGKVNQLAVDQFESQLLHTKTLLVQVEQQIRVAEAKINHAAGRYPVSLERKSIDDYVAHQSFLAGSPDQLIFNRPDIREKEFKLAASNADVAAARAEFYPSLRLTGAAGLSSMNVTKLFDLPGSIVYNIGSGLTSPILQRKQIKARFKGAQTRQAIALNDYHRTLLNAYYEVYIVLSNCYNIEQQIALKQTEADVQRRAFNSSNDLFSVGYATYLEVITAQRRLLEVELELSDLKKQKLKSIALLYRALGGGWKNVPL